MMVYVGLRYFLLSYNANSLSQKLKLEVNHICKIFEAVHFFPLSFSTLWWKIMNRKVKHHCREWVKYWTHLRESSLSGGLRKRLVWACLWGRSGLDSGGKVVANSPPFIHKFTTQRQQENTGRKKCFRFLGKKIHPFHEFIHSEKQQENTGQKTLLSFFGQKTNSPPFIPTQISVLNEVFNSNISKVFLQEGVLRGASLWFSR